MEWVLVNPQIHSTFGSLGCFEGDIYKVNDDCLPNLEEIYSKLSDEDRTLRTFRRAIGFGQNIKKDLVPILIHVKDNPKIVDLTIKILVNLTTPAECLLSIEDLSKSNVGRQTVFELNNLLLTSKEAFVDTRATKSILDYANEIIENHGNLNPIELDNINNSLLLIRNILHIPESNSASSSRNNNSQNNNTTNNNNVNNKSKSLAPTNTNSNTNNQNQNQQTPQNQIIWNLFTHSIDKTLLYLISSNQGTFWSITIVQLLALIYKDQHVETLQKILSQWFEASLSESSEDNESNTSPPDQGSDDSSPMVTSSDPTSDSSDNGCKGKSNEKKPKITPPKTENVNNAVTNQSIQMAPKSQKETADNEKQTLTTTDASKNSEIIISNSAIITNRLNGKRGPTTPLSNLTCSEPNTGPKKVCVSMRSDYSDCGYVTQLETRGSNSTSSNEEDYIKLVHVHPKNHVQKHKHAVKKRPIVTAQERKERHRKKLIERGKNNKINMKALLHFTPSNEDVTNVLKEFTVDFLLKGYDGLVHSLLSQLICNINIQIDTSHFFWLITYFLKFAAQLELDLEYVHQVLSYDMISYLTYEGVNLCEQIQILLSKFNISDLKSCLRRIHLVITAIREFILALEVYKKISHLSNEDRVQLAKLQIRISSSEDLRCLFVLLLRHYQPNVHSKQYLQDLILTNHILITFLHNSIDRPDYQGPILREHLQQFATVEVMHQYGLLLQDYATNGEYVNDCIFTMMHHVAGDLNRISVLYQQDILKTFVTILESNYKLLDDWGDLIKYVINTFVNNPVKSKSIIPDPTLYELQNNEFNKESWTQMEIDNLNWNYMQSVAAPNVIENICKLYKEEYSNKTPQSVARQLLKQKIVTKDEYHKLLAGINMIEEEQECFNCPLSPKVPEVRDEVEILKLELEKQNMKKSIMWLQKLLLEVCFVKINCLKENFNVNEIVPTIEPIPYHNILLNQSIPIVTWNNEQSTAIHNQTFLILLHHLGFHLPADSGKLFVRIPNFWTPDVLFYVASKLGPIDETSLKFSLKELFANSSNSEQVEVSCEKSQKNGFCEWQNLYNNESLYHIQHIQQVSSVLRITELTSKRVIKESTISTIGETSSNWLDFVFKNKSTNIAMESEESHNCDIIIDSIDHDIDNELRNSSRMSITHADDSICETASVASNLTRMYVSDEEDKL